jgi:DHA1 family multidrug resistance protein-like MFS transporter
MMADILREAPFGQLIWWVSGNRLHRYPEEMPGFELLSTYKGVLYTADQEGEAAAGWTISK